MLKRYFVSLLSLFLIITSTYALDPSSKEAKVDLGYRSSLDIGYCPGGLSILNLAIYNSVLNIEQIIPYSSLYFGAEVQDLTSSGIFSANYMRKLNKWLWIGGNICFETAKIHLLDYYTTGEVYTSRISCLPIMAIGKAAWLRKNHISLYSKIGLGVNTIFSEGKFSKFKLSVQLTPVGFEFGGNHVFGFLEAGVGLQGTLIGGVRYVF